MKVLKVKIGESVDIAGRLLITVLSVGNSRVRLGFSGEPDFRVTLKKDMNNDRD